MSKGAPIGNEFWKQRAAHGRDKLFATPELLWEAAQEYFQYCVDTPIISIEFKSGGPLGIQEVEIPKMRAFTLGGLCLYLDCCDEYLTKFENSIKDKKDKESKDFIRIITRIRAIIYEQKFTGAAAGMLNPNIIARDLGLADKKQVDANVTGWETLELQNEDTA